MRRAASDRFPPPPGLTDAQRCVLARRALADGTARRLRELTGLPRDEAARAVNVPTHRLAEWENGSGCPSEAAAVKLWHFLVEACRAAPPP